MSCNSIHTQYIIIIIIYKKIAGFSIFEELQNKNFIFRLLFRARERVFDLLQSGDF